MRIKLGAFADKQSDATKGKNIVIRRMVFMVISFC
jgi:hypothetical protein